MNDLDDIHRAIDDEIYARGKEIAPNDFVRHAIARKRFVQRSAVAGSAALVAAAAVVAVTVVSTSGKQSPAPLAGSSTDSSSYTPLVGTLSPTPSDGSPPVTEQPTPAVRTTISVPPSPNLSTGAAVPNGGLDHLFAAIQWSGSSGSLVVADAATGAVVHTYTTGIPDANSDVLRYGDEAYFVAKTDSHGCAAGWSGVNLVTGEPAAAPGVLSLHPIQTAAIAANGLIVTADGGCASPSKIQTYYRTSLASSVPDYAYVSGYSMPVTAHVIAVSPDGDAVAYVQNDETGVGTLWLKSGITVDPGFSGPIKVRLPAGCTASALAFDANNLAVGAHCISAESTTALSIFQFNYAGAITLRKDLTSRFKDAAISDIAMQGNAIYYVINAEGVESYFYRMTENKTDPELAATNLFHVAAAP